MESKDEWEGHTNNVELGWIFRLKNVPIFILRHH